MKRKKKSGSGLRAVLIVLCIALGLILAALAGGTWYAHRLMNMMNRVESGQEQTLSQAELDQMLADETVPPEETQAPVVKEEDVDFGGQDTPVIETGDHIVNILLIGQDAREGEGRARSDSMILVTFNTKNKTITMTSFLRDMYVQIPGYTDNKLNAAYPAGGMELLNKTLEVNFGIRVDGNVEVNFSYFAKVIDLLGGVDLELREDEAAYINNATGVRALGAGVMHLNGEQALVYSRIRSLDNDADFSRTNRQRKVIQALIEKFRNTKLPTLLKLLDDLLPMITTDMSNSEIISYATELFPMLQECTIVSQRVPADGTYQLATIRGMSCILADMDAARKLLQDTMSD